MAATTPAPAPAPALAPAPAPASTAARNELPIDKYLDDIVEKADENDVLIVTGDTGCGKSTRVPQALMRTKHFQSAARRFIVATQPRRIAAITLAERVANELGGGGSGGGGGGHNNTNNNDNNDRVAGHVGAAPTAPSHRVGYAVGNERRFDEATADVVFCTCGWLVTKLVHNPTWAVEHVSFVVIDEAHEREVDMDVLGFLCNLLLEQTCGRVKVVLMSATLDSSAFDEYFWGKTAKVDINMRCYPVSVHHASALGRWSTFAAAAASNKKTATVAQEIAYTIDRAPVNNLQKYEETAIDLMAIACDVLQRALTGNATLLVFVSGFQAIEDLYTALERQEQSARRYDILTLHSTLEKETQMRVFDDHCSSSSSPSSCVLRVVIATNIAESSVTIPNVQFVFDTGLHKVMRYDDEQKMMKLEHAWISRASAAQRAGRTGRVCAGHVVRFYTEHTYGCLFPSHNPPEIQLIPLEHTILRMYSLKRVSSLDALQRPIECIAGFIDPPSQYAIDEAHRTLFDIGALVSNNDDAGAVRDGDGGGSSGALVRGSGIGFRPSAPVVEDDDDDDEGNNDDDDILPMHVVTTRDIDIPRQRAIVAQCDEQVARVEAEMAALTAPPQSGVVSGAAGGKPLGLREIMQQEEAAQKARERNRGRVEQLEAARAKLLYERHRAEAELDALDMFVEAARGVMARTRREREAEQRALALKRADDGARSGFNVHITSFGQMLMRMPLSFEHAKFVLFGAQFHALAPHFAVMGAYLNVQNVFVVPNHRDNDQQRYQQTTTRTTAGRRYFARAHGSDLLGALEILREYLAIDQRSSYYRNWLWRHGLHEKRVHRFRQSAIGILERLADCGFASAREAMTEMTNWRHGRGMPWDVVNRILPTAAAWSPTCALVVALALRDRVVVATATPPSRAASRNHFQPVADAKRDALTMRATITNFDAWSKGVASAGTNGGTNGGTGTSPMKTFLRDALHKHLAVALRTDDKGVVLDDSVVHGDISDFGSTKCVAVTCYPCNVEHAAHQLRQMMHDETVTFEVKPAPVRAPQRPFQGRRGGRATAGAVGGGGGGSGGGGARDVTVAAAATAVVKVTLGAISGTDVWYWERLVNGRRGANVYDYPPRSPFHSVLVTNYTGTLLDETQSKDEAESARALDERRCPLFAVTPILVKTGASMKAPMLSLVPRAHTVQFLALMAYGETPERRRSWARVHQVLDMYNGVGALDDSDDDDSDDDKSSSDDDDDDDDDGGTDHFAPAATTAGAAIADANNKYYVSMGGVRCGDCVATEAEAQKAVDMYNNAAPLVDALSRWTHDDLLDAERAKRMYAAMRAAMQ